MDSVVTRRTTMKKILITLVLVLFASTAFGRAPRLMKEPGGGAGGGGSFIPNWETCTDDLAQDAGTVFSVSSYQVGPTGHELDYYYTSMLDGTLGGTPSQCSQAWRTYNEGYTEGFDGWPQGSWAYIDVTFSTAKRLGIIEYMLSGNIRYHPRAIVVYARDTANEEWEYVWTFWSYSLLVDSCSYGEAQAIRTFEIPDAFIVNKARWRLHIYRADVWNEYELECANLELYEKTLSCP
jgi:hypothetical protein